MSVANQVSPLPGRKRRRYIHAVNPDLLKLLGIDEADLVANRAGQMGVHQQAAERVQVRRLGIGTWGGAAVFGLFTLLLVVQGGPWPVPLGAGVMWVTTFFLLGRSAQRQTNDAVRALNGPVHVRRTEHLEGPNSSVPHITLWADVAGTSCCCRPPSASTPRVGGRRSARGASGSTCTVERRSRRSSGSSRHPSNHCLRRSAHRTARALDAKLQAAAIAVRRDDLP